MRTFLSFQALFLCLAGLGCSGGLHEARSTVASAPGTAPPLESSGVPVPMAVGDFRRSSSFLGENVGAEVEMDRLAKQAPPSSPAPPASGAGSSGKGDASASQAVAVRAPFLVYTATVTMSVFEVKTSLDRVEAIGRELGGFLAKRDDMSITIRVPVAKFDDAMERLSDAGDMVQRNVQVEDVTEEFIDAEVRLRNARAVRDRVEKLLDRAAKVEESLVLEKELGRVSGEIERLEGRLKLLRDKATFSTIRVNFQGRPRETIDPAGPRLPIPWLNELGLSRLLSL